MQVGGEAGPESWGERRIGRPVIDADVHCNVPGVEALFPWLPEHFQEYIHQSGFKGPTDTAYPKAPTSARSGAAPSRGETPASSLEFVRAHALDAWDAEIAILNCAYAVESIHNADLEVAFARAVNEWLATAWLAKEPRLRASVVVPGKQPDMAAREIEHWAGHPGFVQVFLPVRSPMPYGKRFWHPIFEAAARHDLAVGLHFGGAPGNPPTASGWPSYYIEEYAGMAQAFQNQLMSMIVEGIFDRFSTLRVACVESGFAWLPAFLWRFDKEWKGLRREVPWNSKTPSRYVRDHVRFTLQPIDGPPDGRALLRVIDQLGSDELLMFSTDYPHWHFDSAREAVPSGLPADAERKIMGENARSFYRLPAAASGEEARPCRR